MEQKDSLYILWTTDNLLTSQHMVFIYANDCLRNQRWRQVHIIVWGASVMLLCQDKTMQNELRKFHALGGKILVCRRFAEKLGLLPRLQAMRETIDMDIDYLAESFTDILKSKETLIII